MDNFRSILSLYNKHNCLSLPQWEPSNEGFPNFVKPTEAKPHAHRLHKWGHLYCSIHCKRLWFDSWHIFDRFVQPSGRSKTTSADLLNLGVWSFPPHLPGSHGLSSELLIRFIIFTDDSVSAGTFGVSACVIFLKGSVFLPFDHEPVPEIRYSRCPLVAPWLQRTSTTKRRSI